MADTSASLDFFAKIAILVRWWLVPESRWIASVIYAMGDRSAEIRQVTGYSPQALWSCDRTTIQTLQLAQRTLNTLSLGHPWATSRAQQEAMPL